MQVLYRKKGDEFIEIRVQRVWSDINGINVVLTPEGDYVTLDGELIQDPTYFAIKAMPPEERKKAEAWWRRKQDEVEDKEEVKMEEQEARPEHPSPYSAEMFSAALNTIQKSQEEFFTRLTGLLAGNSTPEAPKLKAVYTRQKGDSINMTAPKNWDEFGFTEQPDWWGVEQERTEIGEDSKAYTYRRYLVPDDQGGDELGD